MMINPGYITKGWRYSQPQAFEQYRRTVMLISIVVLFLLGWLDNITGYEFGFFIFYFIPVAIAAWYVGRKEGIAMAVSAAICWYISDRLTHHPYSRAYFIYWETFMRLISFLTTSLTLSRIRDLVLNEEKLLAELLAARDELHHYRKISFKERNSMCRIIIPTIISLLAATSFAAETVTAEVQETVTTKSGMQYTSLREGSGATPKPTDTVIVNYRGTLLNNREFDSSYKSGRPAEFQLNNVIKCWTEGLQMMKVGGKAKLSCPSNLAYGEEGVSGSIPRNAPLKFEVELIDIK